MPLFCPTLDQHAEDFQRDGAVVIRGLLTEWIEGARRALDENITAPSWRSRTYSADASSPFFQDYCVWNRFEGYTALIAQSVMAELAAKLMKSTKAILYHDHVLVKEPGNGTATPWHQDQPVYIAEGPKTLSLWVPLDPVPEARTIEFVAGSHRLGIFRGKYFNGQDFYESDPLPEIPDIEARRASFSIKRWALEPGDAVAFDFRTLHAAPANPSDQRRRVISVRWVGDDTIFRDSGGTPSPDFPNLTYKPGRPFEGPDFPVLFREGHTTGLPSQASA